MSEHIRAAFLTQIGFCRQTGSALTARVLEALLKGLDHTTRTGARILDWDGDPMVDALMLRIAGGLNALSRSGQDSALSALYAGGREDWEAVLACVLREWDGWLLPWLDGPPQTNEVARSGVLWPGMMEVAGRFGPRLELLELGASGGLNLNMDRFGYDFGGARAGDAASPVQLSPIWDGPRPTSAKVEIVSRRGVDLQPLDLTDAAIAERMVAYIWPDQHERVARANAAIRLLRAHPPQIDAGDGADWLAVQLAKPQSPGVARVVFHSIALQYFPPEGRVRVKAEMEAAGARATPERPLAWLSMEFPEVVTVAHLTLRCWPGQGASQVLAHCHPHGAHITWLGAG